MSIHQHPLPAILNPVGDICVEVTIPAHPDYVALFVRAVRQLENNRLYQRDNVLGANVKIVQEQWRNRTVTPLIEALATGTGMCGVDGECLAYPPFAGFVSYTPQNPYTEPDLVPDGYELPPFYINGMDNEHDLPNYERGDVIVNFGAINLDVGFELENAPQIVLCLEGSGVVELKLLSIAQGGVVVITVDNPPDIFDILAGIISDDLLIVDLNQDIISLPPETATEIIQEITIETEGEHNVYITFLPILDDSLIPLRFGGGLRAVDLCGNIRPCGMPAPEPPPLEGVTELRPEFQFTADCGLEYRLRDQEENIVQDWQAVPGWVDNAAACFGVGAMTPEELCEAVECGIVKVAERILTGEAGIGFTVNPDGSVNVGGGTTDDPDTIENEALEARTGGCFAVVAGYNSIWADMDDWASVPLSNDVISYRLQAKYQMVSDAATDNFVGIYMLVYGTGHINSYTDTLASMLFCGGDNFKGTVAEYVIDSIADVLQEEAFALNAALSDEQISSWFNRGVDVPSTAYVTFPCTKIDNEETTMDMSTAEIVTKNLSGVWKQNHRYRIKASGTFTDSDNPNIVKDAFWSIDTSTGTKTFEGANVISTGGVAALTSAQVPYEPTHEYNVIVEKSSGNSAGQLQRNNSPFNLPNTVGILNFEIIDEGQYTL